MLLPLDDHLLPLPSAHTVKIPYTHRHEKTEWRTYTMVYMNKTTNQQNIHKISVDLGKKKWMQLLISQKTANLPTTKPFTELKSSATLAVGKSCMGTWAAHVFMSLSHTVCLVTAKCCKSSSVIHCSGWEFSHQNLSLDSLRLEHHIRADIIKTELTIKKRSQSTPAITGEIHGAETWESCNWFTIKETRYLSKHTANSLRTFNVRFQFK